MSCAVVEGCAEFAVRERLLPRLTGLLSGKECLSPDERIKQTGPTLEFRKCDKLIKSYKIHNW